jgi:hypothetical protein
LADAPSARFGDMRVRKALSDRASSYHRERIVYAATMPS